MNEIIKAMETRRSIRGYKEDMVPEELIAEVVEAGTYAATGMGRQSPIILAVTNKEVRDRLSKAVVSVLILYYAVFHWNDYFLSLIHI